jgi:hypothetical protein
VGPRKFHLIAITLACLALFASCGIEDYYYLEPVEYVSSNINSATVLLPANYTEFRYYNIYYRIYLSDNLLTSVTTDANRSLINPALATHYNTVDPYTSNDNVSPNAIASIFSTLNYHSLYYIDSTYTYELNANILFTNSSALIPTIPTGLLHPLTSNDLINLDFTDNANGAYLRITYTAPPGTSPVLYLYRSRDRFTPQPNRSFIFSTGAGNLTDEGIITADVNADVEKNPYMSSSDRYAYISLYIVAVGMDPNYTTIYSKPKHIGIFRLPG